MIDTCEEQFYFERKKSFLKFCSRVIHKSIFTLSVRGFSKQKLLIDTELRFLSFV